jgi:hypothetical protein
MEAWNDEPRVRPIPIEDDATSEFESGASVIPDGGDEPPRRPWLPLVLAAVAVAIVIGSVASFGALQEKDPLPADAAFTEPDPVEEEAFSPPTTVAVSLQETIPGVTDRLTLVANGTNGPTALLWEPSFIQPKPLAVVTFGIVEPSIDPTLRLRTATFDAGGDFVAITGIPGGSETEVLRVGTPTDVSAVSMENTTSFVWHATDVAHLAWIELNADGNPTLFSARVNPLSKALMDQKEVAIVTATSRLVRWDGDGFVLNTGQGEIVALTSNGDELWRTLGRALAASSSTILVTDSQADPDRLPSATAIDRFGIEVGVLFEEDVDDELISRTVAMSGSTGLVARIDVRQERTRIELKGPMFVGTRVMQYNDAVEPIGFTSNDKYLVFKADGTNDLIFMNWGLGSIHTLSVPDQFGVVGYDFG